MLNIKINDDLREILPYYQLTYTFRKYIKSNKFFQRLYLLQKRNSKFGNYYLLQAFVLLHVAISNVSSQILPIYYGVKNDYNGDLYLANVTDNENVRIIFYDL